MVIIATSLAAPLHANQESKKVRAQLLTLKMKGRWAKKKRQPEERPKKKVERESYLARRKEKDKFHLELLEQTWYKTQSIVRQEVARIKYEDYDMNDYKNRIDERQFMRAVKGILRIDD